MTLGVRIAVVIILFCFWFLVSYIITLHDDMIRKELEEEHKRSKSKAAHFIKLGLEGPFVLLRKTKSKK